MEKAKCFSTFFQRLTKELNPCYELLEMSLDRTTYSVVIPVYNSTTSLVELVERLDNVFGNIVHETYEVILVDDGSPNPETWPTMKCLADKYNHVKIVQLMRNFGKPGAVMCGFEQAQGDYIFTLDDDLQHFPEDIPKFIERKEHDVVMGAFATKQHSWFKKLTSSTKGWFDYKLLGKPSHIQMGPFRLYKSAIVKSMLRIKTPYPIISSLILHTTRDIATVNVEHGTRKFGDSNYSFSKGLQTFSNLLINNSAFLPRIITIIGISVSVISLVLSIFYIFRSLIFDISVPGWTSLILVVLIANGLILFSVGVTGEYLTRIIAGIESRPAYIIRKLYQKPKLE